MKILNNSLCRKFLNLAVKRTVKYLRENNLKGITLGISGGIDSAIVAVICLRAVKTLKKSAYGAGYEYLFLDCDSDPFDYQRAKILAQKFQFKLKHLDLNKWYRSSPLLKKISPIHHKEKIANANIKCRLRMISLYNSAQLNNYIYPDTDDLSEEFMGFWTKHGDEGDIKIIQHVTKTEAYDIGEFLGIPKIILESKPGDGLKVTPGSLAVDQLGLDYIYIEYIMSRFIGAGFDCNGSFGQMKIKKFENLIDSVANEIKKPSDKIKNVLCQSLKTAYKRKYGDSVIHLLPNRQEFGFPEIGTKEFNEIYLKAIKNLKTI